MRSFTATDSELRAVCAFIASAAGGIGDGQYLLPVIRGLAVPSSLILLALYVFSKVKIARDHHAWKLDARSNPSPV